MDKQLAEMDYKGIFKYFSEISKIPRGSGNEEEISEYLVRFAKSHGLEYNKDLANNVIIIKEASPGYEYEPAIMLQGHMDMVCEKEKDSTHDFLKDGIKLLVDGDFLHADGTTLGADNGIALAYILALLSDETLKHPRIEAVITTDEEVGMNGAKALDLSALKAQYMINLDSEEEGYLLASCAGGLTGTCTLPLKRVSEEGKKIRISIGGLKGGHSGMDIVNNRTNANKLLARLLFDLREKVSFALLHMEGGNKDNVIPREAFAELVIEAEMYQQFSQKIDEIMQVYKKELRSSEPDLEYSLNDLGDGEYKVLHPVSFEKLLFLMIQIPYGVQVMSSDIEGLVESSLNLGIFRLEDEQAVICNSVRSSKSSYKKYISDRLKYLVNFLGGEYIVRSEYPAWEFNKESKLRDHLQRLYKEMYGKEMKVEAIHAGLECGLIAEKMPGIDIVSIGPDMSRVHTIEERLSISSTIRVYKFLERIIEEKIL
ncbi:aminoacyl-histidine dipeptidase [Herbinix luporum]|jgi:dipeptidase D|uniref:aminoacyl-histidine dipeptidase n=1 Tax=Herbinix luporum TaxID=1679721 RepID=UPI0023F1DC23|nr:aminoacyl-histidine dipeptidase [Herbinix luporum]